VDKCSGEYILSRLREKYNINPNDYASLKIYFETKDPFKVLVATILSQNTTDRAALKAYEELENKIGVSAFNLYKSSESQVRDAIRVAGLNKNKARYIKELSKIIVEQFNGDLSKILDKEPEIARKILTSLPGVGEKTADVVLLTCKGYEFFPVDTHIKRIAIRLGIVNKEAKYSEISNKLKQMFRLNLHLGHLLLIEHGRKTCKANKPLCNSCVIRYCCEYGINKSKIINST
jgi:endonuclease-3